MLEIIRKIDVDFYANKLIYVNAKQHDVSRFVLLTCYDQGKKVAIDNMSNSAYVRCKKPDDNGAFNECMITEDGEILVELTEQMLAVPGNVLADVLVYDTTGVIVTTMNFCINVIKTALNNSDIESTSEYLALHNLIIEAKAEYDYVIEQSKSNLNIAVTSAEKAKASEEASLLSEQNAKSSENAALLSEQNAKLSETASKVSEEAALISEQNALASQKAAKTSENAAEKAEVNALKSEQKALVSEQNALVSEQNAFQSEENAKSSENAAKTSEGNAKESENNAGVSEGNAKVSEENALKYSQNAETSENNAKSSEQKALTSEQNAKSSENIAVAKAQESSNSAVLSKTYADQAKESLDSIDESAQIARSYAVGDTGYRNGETTDNAKYYYEQTKALAGNQEAATLNEVQEYLGIS